MIFYYKATSVEGKERSGSVEAQNADLAVDALQKRGLIVLEIKPEKKGGILSISLFERVSAKEMVILSRQLSTLFEAKVPVLESFRLISKQVENPLLNRTLIAVADDIQGGKQISAALSAHPKVFSDFYINMVLTGEETGKLSEIFQYLAAYLERQYELASKAKHAMIYPSFIILAFVAVMGLMFTVVIPKLSDVILSVDTEIPVYTKIVINTSNFFVSYGIFVLLFFIGGILFLWRFSQSENGKITVDKMRLKIPYLGDLYKKLFLSRIADNLDTMLSSGISMVKAVEITSNVVGSHVYRSLLEESIKVIRGGGSLSEALSTYDEVPLIMIQMLKIGEETGKLGFIFGTVSRFYKQEVEAAIETMVALIEPVLIIVLGVGVGVLLTSVLLPIYNIAGTL